ncbi:MAG: hypothetical protein GY810_14985 [Aureispira sp.]|nr:hypothetical protein [Aureispira sp.]
MRFYTILITLYLLSNNFLIAQSHQENLDKYWLYRTRLVGTNGQGGFLDIGTGQGQSLVATNRDFNRICSNDWHMVDGKCHTREGKGGLSWADASLYQGFYIGMLALEYANLERAKQPLDKVGQELWYAMLTVERLDSLAEIALGKKEGKLDGFFLRDDVPANFYYEKDAPNDRRFGANSQNIECVSSDYSCGEEVAVEKGGFISQDQVIGLFIGFSLIKKLVADKRYKKNLPTYGEKAALIAHRIADYMSSSGWKLKDPDGKKIPDKWGGNALGMSYPIAKAANFITDGKHSKTYIRKGASILGKPIYGLLHASLAFQHQTNAVLCLMSMTMLPKRTRRGIARKSIKHDVIIMPLIHSILFDYELHKKLQKEDFEELLNTAPMSGPCFETEGCEAPDGWKSFDRWLHPRFKNGNPYGIKNETPGVDYMLLYNLYHYYYHKDLPTYKQTSKN